MVTGAGVFVPLRRGIWNLLVVVVIALTVVDVVLDDEDGVDDEVVVDGAGGAAIGCTRVDSPSRYRRARAPGANFIGSAAPDGFPAAG